MEEKIKELIALLNEASDAYYNGRKEVISNFEWDAKFDELQRLEQETGIVLPDSPTQKVSADNTKGKKETHEFPALSLAKTKSVEELIKWSEGKPIWMSWKLDGLTLVATYDNGKLSKLLTRGNGTVGTNITWMAPAIQNLPQEIAYKGHLVVRGEALISYSDFEKINAKFENEEERYANPRNLASGTLNLDDLNEIRSRNVQLLVFTPVYMDDSALAESEKVNYNFNTWEDRMNYLDTLGFSTVERMICYSPQQIEATVEFFTDNVDVFEFPVDGLVICYDDWKYAQTGSVTGHHATRAGFAFKWKDEVATTKVTDIYYETTRTGIISQVALFEPVEIAGTMVSRALIPNMNYRSDLDIKIGDEIEVIKANMIIPQITGNHDANKNRKIIVINDVTRYNYPETCPCCGGEVGITVSEQGTMNLICNNPYCSMKQIKKLTHFADRDCMDIQGLSEAKISFLLNHHFINETPVSLYYMANEYKTTGKVTNDQGELLSTMDGWGEKSVTSLMKAIDQSRYTTFIKFIHGMGIPNVGKGQAKLLAPAIINWVRENPDGDAEGISSQDNLVDALCSMAAHKYDFTQIDGFGEVIAMSLTRWLNTALNSAHIQDRGMTDTEKLLEQLVFTDTYTDYVKDVSNSAISGKTFVITGKVNHYVNRDALKEEIEGLGGKVSGSVTSKTDFLINNDVTSTSGKNKKAKELNIPIISEEDFLQMMK